MLKGITVELPPDASALQRRSRKKSRKKKSKKEKSKKKHKHSSSSSSSSSSSDEAVIVSPPKAATVHQPAASAATAAAIAAANREADLEVLQNLLSNPFASSTSPSAAAASPAVATTAAPKAAATPGTALQQGREALKAFISGESPRGASGPAHASGAAAAEEPESLAAQRELNPYYRGGGSGLPPEGSPAAPEPVAASAALSPGAQLWQRRQLKRLQQQAAEEGIPLAAALRRHFGSLTDEALEGFQKVLAQEEAPRWTQGRGRGPPRGPPAFPREQRERPSEATVDRFRNRVSDRAEATGERRGDRELLRERLRERQAARGDPFAEQQHQGSRVAAERFAGLEDRVKDPVEDRVQDRDNDRVQDRVSDRFQYRDSDRAQDRDSDRAQDRFEDRVEDRVRDRRSGGSFGGRWQQPKSRTVSESSLTKLERKLLLLSQQKAQESSSNSSSTADSSSSSSKNCNGREPSDANAPESTSSRNDNSTSSSSSNQSTITSSSSDDLNALSAKALKARLRGDIETAKQLEALMALKSLEGKGMKTNTAEAPEVVAATAAVTAAAAYRPQRQTKDSETAGNAPRGVKRKTQQAEQSTDGVGGDSSRSLLEMAREEKALSGAANEKQMNKLLMTDPGAIESMKRKMRQQKQNERSNRLNQAETRCLWCLDSSGFDRLRGESLLSLSPFAFLCAPPMNRTIHKDHLLIIPVPHCSAVTGLEEEAFECMRNYMKTLVAFFASRGEAPLFLETVPKQNTAEKQLIGLGFHTEVDVLPLPADRLQEARLYFKKAFSEAEGFWQSHKTYIEAKGRGGVRGTIPKGFPYIYVDFSLEDGLAHVIEDGEEFSRAFGREVFLGMLEKEKTERPFRDMRLYKENVQRLRREYAPFDWVQVEQ